MSRWDTLETMKRIVGAGHARDELFGTDVASYFWDI
jgi:hypothetical protein